MVNEPKTWGELADRLETYAAAASTLGGLNDLDKALYMAAEGLRMTPACKPVERTADS